VYASVKERKGSVSSRIRRDERKNARVPMKRFAREKNTTLSGRGTSHTKQVPLRTLMIKLNSWLISAWNANVSVSSSPAMMIVVIVRVSCALCNGVKISPTQEREKVKRQSFRV